MNQNEKNMKLYEVFRSVPSEAKKTIGAGKIKGFTDINPMWRMKVLTEQFGPCGFGWKYTIDNQWIEACETNGEKKAFCNVLLYVKYEGEWSEAIPGTGGSIFVAKNSRGIDVSDECYKMALTDALSVACKALGIGADVYYEKDRTKYNVAEEMKDSKPAQAVQLTQKQIDDTIAKIRSLNSTQELVNYFNTLPDALKANGTVKAAANSRNNEVNKK